VRKCAAEIVHPNVFGVLVSSNHWFVLSSQALTDALAEHIPLVILKGEGKHPLYFRHQESVSSTSSTSTLLSLSSSSNNNNNNDNDDSNENTSY
jgi:hypothetical protein